jgi:hypothetical protein
MAGNENSGGYRPTAPQNNTGVSAVGGNGSADGVPNIDYTGMAYGQNKSVNDAMDSGLAMGQEVAQASPMGAAGLPQVTPITAPSETPERGVSYGMPFGDGPNSVPLPQGMAMQQDPSEQLLRALYQQNPTNPDLGYIVEMLDARTEQVQ